MKIVWDRGSPKQFYQSVDAASRCRSDADYALCRNHVAVEPITWAEQDLPLPAEVPNLSLQVIVRSPSRSIQ